MKLSKREYQQIVTKLDKWLESEKLTVEKYNELKESIKIKEIDWRRIAQNMLALAVLFMIVAFLHLIVEEWIIDILMKFFALSDKFFMTLLFICFAGLTSLATVIHKKSKKDRSNIFRESLLILALASFVGFLFFLSDIYCVSAHIGILFVLLTSAITLLFGKIFNSQLFWILGIVGSLMWFGIHTSYTDNQSPLFWGMNLAVRYFVLLIVLNGILLLLQKIGLSILFESLTFNILMGIFIIALWFVALFGNFSSFTEWKHSSPLLLLPGGIIMFIISSILWFVGKKSLNSTLKWFGAFGLLADVYTQYFLFLWNPLPASIFFFILALSFFIIGRKAEIIWGK